MLENKKRRKRLTKEERDKQDLELKIEKKEFAYIDDLVKIPLIRKQLQKAYFQGKIIVGDPGKRAPLTLLGKGRRTRKTGGKLRNGLILFSYTSQRRLKETKRIKYNKLVINKKKKEKIDNESIEKYEQKLSKFNAKTMNLKSFLEFAKLKITIKKALMNSSFNTYVKKLKFFSYINKRRHEDNLLNELEKIYGKDFIFVIGDWSKGSNIKHASMPNMGLRRILAKRFRVYTIDEFNTSKLYHKTEEEGEKLKLDVKKVTKGKVVHEEKQKEMHSILTFKTSNKGSECINRDYNATLNMRKIVEKLVMTGERPIKYRRKSSTINSQDQKDKLETVPLGMHIGTELKMKKRTKKECAKKPKKRICKNIPKKNKILIVEEVSDEEK